MVVGGGDQGSPKVLELSWIECILIIISISGTV